MSKPARFIGFAFANADFLFEVDREGRILFAVGAGSEFVPGGVESVIGRPASALFDTADRTKLEQQLAKLPTGRRAGPCNLALVQGGRAALSMFCLPQNDNRVSCTLTRIDGPEGRETCGRNDATGLLTKEDLLEAAAKATGRGPALALVEVPDLSSICAGLTEGQTDGLLAKIGAAIRGVAPRGAGRVSETGFGAITDARDGPIDLGGSVRSALVAGGFGETRIQETLISLKGRDLSDDQRVLAVRYVLDRFSRGDHASLVGGDLASAFATMMDETQERLRALTNVVADGAFSLAFQPIQALKTGLVAHYEALARFAPGMTGETVQFVESLGIAGALDLAVALKVFEVIEAGTDDSVSIAFNVSANTIASPASFGMLAGFLTRKRALAPRVLIEITETAQMADLGSANTVVATLRDMGYRVGLDDFGAGAGAASLHYLHALAVDFVKFDGSLIKKIGTSARDDTLLRGMLKLCTELGVTTIAECIETADQARRVRDMGFDYAQGYHLGKPVVQIAALNPHLRTAKRQGIHEEWG